MTPDPPALTVAIRRALLRGASTAWAFGTAAGVARELAELYAGPAFALPRPSPVVLCAVAFGLLAGAAAAVVRDRAPPGGRRWALTAAGAAAAGVLVWAQATYVAGVAAGGVDEGYRQLGGLVSWSAARGAPTSGGTMLGLVVGAALPIANAASRDGRVAAACGRGAVLALGQGLGLLVVGAVVIGVAGRTFTAAERPLATLVLAFATSAALVLVFVGSVAALLLPLGQRVADELDAKLS